MMVLLFVGAVLGWLAGFYFFNKPSVIDSVQSSELGARLSVVIPARNEEHNLKNLLSSLNGQRVKPLEVIVVDDHSSDATAQIAHSFGAVVVESKPLPTGWTGKNHACFQGANVAQGDYLLFVDADTTFSADGLERILSLPNIENTVYSICPYHQVEQAYEQFSAFFNLIMVVGVGAFTPAGNLAADKRLFGQSLLISKKIYERVGGHEAVKGKILENFFLAEKLRELNVSTSCHLGKNTLSMRMFPGGFSDLCAGWRKAFADGAAHTPKKILWSTIVWLSGAITASVLLPHQLLTNPGNLLAYAAIGLYLAYVVQLGWMWRQLGRFSLLTAVFFPLPLIFYQTIFFQSLWLKSRGKSTQWKGRRVLGDS